MTTTTLARAISPTDIRALAGFGEAFWLDELQILRSGERLSDEGRATFEAMLVEDVDTLAVEANMDNGCSERISVIATMPTGGSVTGMTVLRAVWTGYMASLKATMDGGKNPRAHIGHDPAIMTLVDSEAAALGMTLTPCDEVYGSGGTYLEELGCRYDAATRTLFVNPSIGS